MNWKKLLALMLIVIMSMALFVGCSSNDAGAVVEDSSDTSADQAVEWADDIQAIIDRGVLRVGVKSDVLGFGFQDTVTGEYEGIEIDIAALIADYLGVEVAYTAVTAANRTDLLDAGEIDCIVATFTITEERALNWSFTTPYYEDAITALVTADSGITNLEDLVGATIGVSAGSTAACALVAYMVEVGLIEAELFDYDAFDATTWTDTISFCEYDGYPAVSAGLYAGEIDAFCADRSILSYYKTVGRYYIEDSFSPQDYGVATTLDSGLSELCEELITTWLADGTIDALIATYSN